MCVDSPYIVDRISFELPLMKQMGDSVQMEVTSVRPYEAFYDDLEKLAWLLKTDLTLRTPMD